MHRVLIFLTAALAAFFMSGCMPESPPKTTISAAENLCGSDISFYENYKADVIARNPGIELLEMYLDQADVALFVKGYNETPPQSHETSPHIALWTSKDALDAHLNQRPINNSIPGANVLFIDASNCITRIETIPFFILEYLLRGHPFIPGSRES
jgi:hypothetical protein